MRKAQVVEKAFWVTAVLQLVPREDIIDVWRNDYEAMKESMIYGKKPTFEELVDGMSLLQELFRSVIVE